ncbi:protein phosphatase 1 regulatory subunit 3C [Anarrhichthys ocellatus]|uniref:protein phosphatase 1 regulatory subunit 3C n=1 Tax=Anarrhichthys ocellatus TaxID=433405 RepID=UPI0012ED3C88|nr:protein phosphatase 1 regulatory subunit 3C-like [Anarrhichthys ocellatus]
MSCTRVLHAFGSHRQQAVKPVDLAVCLSLSRHQPLYQQLSKSPLKLAPHRHQPTGLHPPHSSSSSPIYSSSSLSSPVPPEPRSCFRRDAGGGPSKKRVVFADARGLALTAVRLFIPEHTASTLTTRPSLAKLQSHQSTSDKLQRHRVWFTPPTLASQASQASLSRQRDVCVQLESCKFSEHSLSGKVRVNHVSVDNAVYLRVTFDSWRSHHDIPCMFLEQQQRFGGSDGDLFAFDLSLPKNIDPTEHVEFYVAFRPGNSATPLWDDNRGQNYRVCVETGGSNGQQGNAYCCHPTLSQHRPPLWLLHVSPSMQNSADLQHL